MFNVYGWVCDFSGVASSSSPSPGVLAVGQMGGFGYGAVNMEKNFRVSHAY